MKRITNITLAVVAAMTMNSCTALGINTQRNAETVSDRQIAQAPTTPTNPSTAKADSQTATKADNTVKKAFGKKGKKDKKSKMDQNNAPATPADADLSRQIVGEWSIIKVGNTKIEVDDNQPYANFGMDRKLYASNGCNVLNGYYSLNGHKISFSQMLSTMMACPDNGYSDAITGVFSDGATVHAMIQQMGNETYMYLNDSTGRELMTLCRHNMNFLDGQWLVTAINGQPVNDEEANLFFDIASLKVHGNTGCNYFNGDILISPGVANSINFYGMAVTRMACPKGDQERTMLVALEETTTAVRVNADTAALVNAQGRQVITLTRASN